MAFMKKIRSGIRETINCTITVQREARIGPFFKRSSWGWGSNPGNSAQFSFSEGDQCEQVLERKVAQILQKVAKIAEALFLKN